MADFEVILSLLKAEDGRPVNTGDLLVLCVDRPDVVPPAGWTVASSASGTFFWRTATGSEPVQVALSAPGPFAVMMKVERPVAEALGVDLNG